MGVLCFKFNMHNISNMSIAITEQTMHNMSYISMHLVYANMHTQYTIMHAQYIIMQTY